jgi:hypothetical protein
MDEWKKSVLNVYFQDRKDMGRFTSQDICDNVRDMVSLTPDEVTEYLMQRGYILQRQDDRLVWTKL